MDDSMYAIMRFDWNGSHHEWGGDTLLAVAMTVETANSFVKGWKAPADEDLVACEDKEKTDDHGRLWRFFEGPRGDRMTMRVDRVPLV